MNILIKLMSIVSLVIAPTLAQISGADKTHVLLKEQPETIKIETKPLTVAIDNKTKLLR